MALTITKKGIDDFFHQPTAADLAMFKFYKNNPDFAAIDVLNQDLAPFQRVCINGVQQHSYVICVLARGSGKTRMIAVNAALACMFNPKMRVGFFAPTFRQSKYAFSELLAIINDSPHLEASIKNISRQTDMWSAEFHNGAFAFALPLASDNPASIRGTRVHVALLDEYPHIQKETLDLVINPMLATQRNPMLNVRRIEKQRKEEAEGKTPRPIVSSKNKICGFSSAYFKFNHMFQTMEIYKKLATEQKAKEGKTDYATYVFNYKHAPEGFFDEKMIEHARRTSSDIAFRMEYLSEFPSDSDGFFKRSLIDACMSRPPDDFQFQFIGKKDSRYFMGIDPAKEKDNFCILIIEQTGDLMKLIAIYTFHKTAFYEIATFVRELCKKYNIEMIGIDAAGGGSTFKDDLSNPITATDVKDILLNLDDEDSVAKQGRRIVKMINFTSQWISEANFDMKASMEHKKFLLPSISEGSTYIKPEADVADLSDTMVVEYLAFIDELQSIEMTATKAGSLHFDTPSANMRKDRYSAALIAHRIASDFLRQGYQKKELTTGGWINDKGNLISPDIAEDYIWQETRIIDEIKAAQKAAYDTDVSAGALSD